MKSSLWTKAIWFRLAVMAVDFVILSFFLNSLFLSGMATLLRHAIQTLLYWYHERVWQRHDWGMENGDTKWRTLAKTVTFRLLTSGKDLLVITFFTAQVTRGLTATLVIALINSVIYYIFERIWSKRNVKMTPGNY